MEYQLNQLVHGFRVLRKEEVADIHSLCYVFQHEKSGARLFYAANKDENKVFFISFCTPPLDDCGTAHIMEHSVLCGSKKYPSKDPFNELMKGSLNTYLNALTYADKTMYPVASCNQEDFKHLMDVYLDAVFFPNVMKDRRIFWQEGWHHELLEQQGLMTVKGVVYNEMKGALASAEGVLDGLIHQSLFAGGTYGFESGGDPKAIPSLTYENFQAFYQRYYHPSNSFIYLYGDLDIDERLSYLDREYLGAWEDNAAPAQIQYQTIPPRQKVRRGTYSVPLGTEAAGQSLLSLNFMVGSPTDRQRLFALVILSYVLMETGASPVKQALLSRGIGQSGEAWLDSSTGQMVFSFVVKDAQADQLEAFGQTVFDALRQLAEHGFLKEQLRSAIHSYEFSLREEDYGYRPKGLAYGMDMMKSWLNGGDPIEAMKIWTYFDALQEGVETGYFEQLVREVFLENEFYTLTAADPQEGKEERAEEEEKAALEAQRTAMTQQQRQQLVADTQALLAWQSQSDRPEDIAKVPCLKREDIDPMHRERDICQEDGVLCLPQQTNGIFYARLYFSLAGLSEAELADAAILARILGRMDTRQYRYDTLPIAIDLATGGISARAGVLPQGDTGRPVLVFQCRALVRNLEETMELSQEILLHTVLQVESLRKILLEWKADFDRFYDNDGHAAAIQQAAALVDGESALRDRLEGLSFFDALQRRMEDLPALMERLRVLAKRVLVRENVHLAFSTDAEDLPVVKEQLLHLQRQLPAGKALQGTVTLAKEDIRAEAVTTGAKIVYNASVGHFNAPGHQGGWNVVKNLINTEYLWNEVRVKGGAYGCGMNVNRRGYLSFYSYRDPNLKATYRAFEGGAAFLRAFSQSGADLTKYILGAVNVLDRPKSFSDRFSLALSRYFAGVTAEMLQQERQEMLSLTAADLQAYAKWMAETHRDESRCTFGSAALTSEAADFFDQVRTLTLPRKGGETQ